MISRRVDNRIGRQRRKNLRPLRGICAEKPLRHHAHHGERRIGNHHFASHHIRRSVEPVTPELFADDHSEPCRTASRLIVLRRKVTAQQGRSFESLKILSAHQHTRDDLVAGLPTYQERVRVVGKYFREDVVPGFQTAKQRRAEKIVILVRRSIQIAQHGQLLGVRHWKWPQQQSVDQREDRRVRAHAQSKRKYGNHRETGRLPHLPEREQNVASHLLDERQAALHSILFLRLCHPAEGSQRHCSRLLRCHPTLLVLFNGELDVDAELFVEVVVPLPLSKQRCNLAQQYAYPDHESS